MADYGFRLYHKNPTLAPMPGTQRGAVSDTVHTCTENTEGKNMGQTIKQPSSLGFTVNLHHSSIFLPAALNINTDS